MPHSKYLLRPDFYDHELCPSLSPSLACDPFKDTDDLIHLYFPLALSTGSYPQVTPERVCWMALLCKELLPLKDVKGKDQGQLSRGEHSALKSHQLWSKLCPRNTPAAQTRCSSIHGSCGRSERSNVTRAEGGRKTPAKQRQGFHARHSWVRLLDHTEGDANRMSTFCALYIFL